MAQNITIAGASFSDVPALDVKKTGSGYARFTDVTPTTATASDVSSSKWFYTSNGTYTQGTNSGGGGSSLVVGDASATVSSASSSIAFTGLGGEPTSFVIYPDSDKSTGNPANVVAVVFDGSDLHGQTASTTSGANARYDTGFSKSYSGGTLTVTATSAVFGADGWNLDYTYGGGTIETADVQVGSGATSITFTGLDGEPSCWSCIFKSDFSTSSGYQRVMFTRGNGSDVYGACLDSSAHLSDSYWSDSYSNGSLTITSNGTNAGGYFHQPGYYQLTYALDTSGNYQTKTVTPTTSTQTVTADSGFDALKRVTVNAIPSQYIVPTGNIPITSNTSTPLDIAQYATATVNVSGGASKNVQVAQSTSRATSSTYTSVISLTCSTAGTYDIYWDCFRSSTSGTSGSQLYIGDSASGNANTTFTNHVQTNHRTGVTLAKNQTVAVYARSRGSNYYAYVGTLVIIQTA